MTRALLLAAALLTLAIVARVRRDVQVWRDVVMDDDTDWLAEFRPTWSGSGQYATSYNAAIHALDPIAHWPPCPMCDLTHAAN